MSISALEINDAGLALIQEDRLVLESPGVAVLEDKHIVLGEDAMHQLRLKPGKVMTRFWEALNLDALPAKSRLARTQADLAYSHLNDIWQRLAASGHGELILVVPGVYSKQQLGLLLGIASECGIPVCGLVDTSVAAARYSAPGKTLLHVDVHLHRVIVSQLQEGEAIRRESVDTIATVGLASLADAWCNRIADVFVKNTRFDPMHQAESEQQMYDKLPAWLSALEQEGSASLEIESRGKTHQLILKREQLLQASEEAFRQVTEQIRARIRSKGGMVQLTHRAHTLPGLAEAIRSIDDCQVHILGPYAGARGALRQAEAIRSSPDNLRFVTSLPWNPEANAGQQEAPGVTAVSSAGPSARARLSPQNTPGASHLVWQGTAYRVGSKGLCFFDDEGGRLDVAGNRTPGVALATFAIANGELLISPEEPIPARVNGTPLAEQAALSAGDRVLLGDGRYELLAIRLDS